jgi:CBS domain-containing membrane protein
MPMRLYSQRNKLTNVNKMTIIPPDPVSLTVKGKLISVASCFLVILVMAWLSQLASPYSANPYLIASMGASTIIVFIIPNSPLAQPWPLVGGQLVSAATGIICAQMIPTDTLFAGAFAVGSSVAAMLLLRCLHPPGTASALAPILGGEAVKSLGFSFLLIPVGINVAVMLAMAFIIN